MLRKVSVVIGVVLTVCSLGSAADWPTIPKEEKALQSVQDFPNAAAVILKREGTVHLDEDSRSSFIEVYSRIKILTQEGVDFGSISLPSSDYMRVKNLEGRTHLPDGTVVELPKDATFEKEFSDYYGSSVVSCAMPEVAKGAIIEYRYRTYFDSIFFPRMWFFQSEIPTLESRVSFEIPKNIAFAPLIYKTLSNVEFKEETRETVSGGRLTYTAFKLPPVPEEASRFPFRDLAYRTMLLPISRRRYDGMKISLFDNWKNSVDLVWGTRQWGYLHFMGDSGAAKKQAKSLAGSGTDAERAARIYRWVRDEIDTQPFGSVWVDEVTADDVVRHEEGDMTEKALLLHSMLDSVKIDSDIVWVNPKTRSRVEQNIPDPTQFYRVLVRADLGKEGPVFLDPCDRTLAFGALEPSMSGVPCLIVTKKKQEWSTTPALPPEASTREVELDLEIDADGRVLGTGSMDLSGHHAWRKLGWNDTEAETMDAWVSWIEARYPTFDIDDVEFTENIEDQAVTVGWSMRQRDEDVFPDEVVLLPASPLAIGNHPYTLHPNRRQTPAQLLFADVDRVVLRLQWPEGWILDGEPALKQFANDAGKLETSIEVDEAERTAVLTRALTISKTEFVGGPAYAGLRDLFNAAAANDAEELFVIAE